MDAIFEMIESSSSDICVLLVEGAAVVHEAELRRDWGKKQPQTMPKKIKLNIDKINKKY